MAEWQELSSDEHFSGDGTLIEASASYESFQPHYPDQHQPPSSRGRNAELDFRGQRRSNQTHASLIRLDAKSCRKCDGTPAVLSQMGHLLMDNRHSAIVDVETTQATAERAAALRIRKRIDDIITGPISRNRAEAGL